MIYVLKLISCKLLHTQSNEMQPPTAVQKEKKTRNPNPEEPNQIFLKLAITELQRNNRILFKHATTGH